MSKSAPPALCSGVATSHPWLLSTCNVVSVTEDLTFSLYFTGINSNLPCILSLPYWTAQLLIYQNNLLLLYSVASVGA